MPTIIAHHEVARDTDHWLAWPKREEVLPSLGVNNIGTFLDRDNPNKVALLMDVVDLDALLASLANPPPELLRLQLRLGSECPFGQRRLRDRTPRHRGVYNQLADRALERHNLGQRISWLGTPR